MAEVSVVGHSLRGGGLPLRKGSDVDGSSITAEGTCVDHGGGDSGYGAHNEHQRKANLHEK